jgi:hypothetical protein
MKSKLLFLFLAFTQIISAQNFTEVTGTPFTGVAQSSIAFADVDGDNDLDVLITGLNFMGQPPGVRISKLYTNDGVGNFTEVFGTPFAGVEEGSIAFADVDGDNDQDVLITGGAITSRNCTPMTAGQLYRSDRNTFPGRQRELDRLCRCGRRQRSGCAHYRNPGFQSCFYQYSEAVHQ